MIDNIEYYMEYLDGLTKDMPEEFVKLAQVFELSVFEPVYMEGEDDIYAAYLMNDSVESYFVRHTAHCGNYSKHIINRHNLFHTLDQTYITLPVKCWHNLL